MSDAVPGAQSTRAGSVSYKMVGAAVRRSFQKAAFHEPRLSGSDWRVLAAVHTLTASYSKLADYLYVAELARKADLDRKDPMFKATKKSLKRLQEAGAIEWQPSRRHGERSLVSLPIDLSVAEAS
jgi:hypothetical protein